MLLRSKGQRPKQTQYYALLPSTRQEGAKRNVSKRLCTLRTPPVSIFCPFVMVVCLFSILPYRGDNRVANIPLPVCNENGSNYIDNQLPSCRDGTPEHLPDDLVCPISGQRNGVLHLHFGPSRILVGGHIAVFVHGDHACYRLVGLGLFFKQRQHFSFEKTKPPLSYICPARPSSCSYRRRAPKNFNRSFPHFSPSASPFFLGGF